MNDILEQILMNKKNELLEIFDNKTKNKKMTDDVNKLDYNTNKILASFKKK